MINGRMAPGAHEVLLKDIVREWQLWAYVWVYSQLCGFHRDGFVSLIYKQQEIRFNSNAINRVRDESFYAY